MSDQQPQKYEPVEFNWELGDAANPETNYYIEFDTWLVDVVLTDDEKFELGYWENAGE